MLDIEFHENPFNEEGDIAEEVLCSASKVPFTDNRSGPKLQVL